MHASASMFRPLVTSRRWALATALGSAALLGGCVVAPVPGPVYAEPAGYPVNAGVYAPVAPPQPYYEVQPAVPFPGAVWISGYWGYNAGRHQWTPGHYERPRPGYRWEPRRWDHSPHGGWYLRGGGWVR